MQKAERVELARETALGMNVAISEKRKKIWDEKAKNRELIGDEVLFVNCA